MHILERELNENLKETKKQTMSHKESTARVWKSNVYKQAK